MGKEAILDKIQSDAQIHAKAIVEEANNKANEILAVVAEGCKAYLANTKSEIDSLEIDVANRSEAVAKLDAKKLILKAKTQIVDDTFKLALQKLQKLPKNKLTKVLMGMLNYAEDGDVITISANEKDIITKDVVSAYAKEKGIKLSLNKSFGDFDGGMMLSGSGIDKNLTFEVELALLRDTIEAEVAKELLADV